MEDNTQMEGTGKLLEKKNAIEQTLSGLKSEKEAAKYKHRQLSDEIKRGYERYAEKKEKLDQLRLLVSEGKEKYAILCSLIRKYREKQQHALEKEYRKSMEHVLQMANKPTFKFRLNIIEDFDYLKSINTGPFPILQKKIKKYLISKQHDFKIKLYEHLYRCMGDAENLPNLIFYLNFLIRYEKYFSEDIFTEFIKTLIQEEFQYHFYGEQETNRLDKPEWMFEFLEKKYEEYVGIHEYYRDCAESEGAECTPYQGVIENTMVFVEKKIVELARNEGPQRVKLILNFAYEFQKFQENVHRKYNVTLVSTELYNLLSRSHDDFVRSEMQRISRLSYVQWFSEYRELLGTTMKYFVGLGRLKTDFSLETLGEYIVVHVQAFIDNLMFIDREEIRVACFMFSEVEDLKNFVYLEMNEYLLSYPEARDFSGKTIGLFNDLMVKIFQILKHLAENDIFRALERIDSYPHVSNEAKRLFVVEIHRIFDEYKGCSYNMGIENHIKAIVDNFISSSVILKMRLTSEEYLEFRMFYKKIKGCFSSDSWDSDLLSEALERLFNGEKVRNKQLMTLYSS